MMMKAEIVIIGGGVVGASVAYHLTQRGARDVLILERESRQGMGSTGKATGGVRSQFETDINIKMSLYSLAFFDDWEIDCEYEPAGYLFFATTEGQFDYLKRNVEKQRALGVRDVEIVDSESIKRLVPILNCDDILGGSFGKQDGFINPLAVMRGFTESTLRNGAKIEFDTRVLKIETRNGKTVAVGTNKGRIECENIVLCTGAWAKQLAATARIDLPVEPQRRQIVWARSTGPLPPNLPMVIDIGSGFHFRPARDWNASVLPRTAALRSKLSKRTTPSAQSGGHPSFQSRGALNHDVLFAYPDPDEPASLNTSFDESFIAKVYERAKHRAPFLFETEVIHDKCRAGLYENTPDHHAILGGCEVEGLYFANGFSGHGVMHSPATGRALSEIILDGKASFLDVSCLGLDRFAKGELLH
ncbi:MAG: FAD-binding oxidoreductase, partial [Pyrinomonadaceae bacterium]